MNQISPTKVLSEVATAVPASCRGNFVVIGSLAAGYHFFKSDPSKAVRTKDVDCVLAPFHAAVDAGQAINHPAPLACGTRWGVIPIFCLNKRLMYSGCSNPAIPATSTSIPQAQLYCVKKSGILHPDALMAFRLARRGIPRLDAARNPR